MCSTYVWQYLLLMDMHKPKFFCKPVDKYIAGTYGQGILQNMILVATDGMQKERDSLHVYHFCFYGPGRGDKGKGLKKEE